MMTIIGTHKDLCEERAHTFVQGGPQLVVDETIQGCIKYDPMLNHNLAHFMFTVHKNIVLLCKWDLGGQKAKQVVYEMFPNDWNWTFEHSNWKRSIPIVKCRSIDGNIYKPNY